MRCLTVLTAILLAVATPVMAEIQSGTARGCDFELTGTLSDGDAATLKRLAEPHFGEYRTFCLNSPGGSFTEALNIAEFLMHEQPYIRTVVGPGHSCYSACALAFMAGAFRATGQLTPDRWLHVTAKLGFHAPYIDPAHLGKRQMSAAEMAAAFDAAMRSGQRLLAQLAQQTTQRSVANPEAWVHPGLIQRFLKLGRSEFYMIDTVGKAAAFNIFLYGHAFPDSYSIEGLAHACQNHSLRTKDRFLEPTEKSKIVLDAKPDVVAGTTLRDKPAVELRFGYGNMNVYCAVTFGGKLPGTSFEHLAAVLAEEGGKTGVEFFPLYPWPASTRLAGLPVNSRQRTPQETSIDSGSWRPGPYRVDASLAAALSGARSVSGGSSQVPSRRGPSFDCVQNTGAMEQMICRDEGLSALDADLGEAWLGAVARVSASERDNLRSDQRAWLRERAACGLDAACVREKYEERIDVLKAR